MFRVRKAVSAGEPGGRGKWSGTQLCRSEDLSPLPMSALNRLWPILTDGAIGWVLFCKPIIQGYLKLYIYIPSPLTSKKFVSLSAILFWCCPWVLPQSMMESTVPFVWCHWCRWHFGCLLYFIIIFFTFWDYIRITSFPPSLYSLCIFHYFSLFSFKFTVMCTCLKCIMCVCLHAGTCACGLYMPVEVMLGVSLIVSFWDMGSHWTRSTLIDNTG